MKNLIGQRATSVIGHIPHFAASLTRDLLSFHLLVLCCWLSQLSVEMKQMGVAAISPVVTTAAGLYRAVPGGVHEQARGAENGEGGGRVLSPTEAAAARREIAKAHLLKSTSFSSSEVGFEYAQSVLLVRGACMLV